MGALGFALNLRQGNGFSFPPSAPALSSTPPMITFLPITFVNIRLDVFSCLNSVGAIFHFLVAHRAKSSCVPYSSRVSLVPHTLHLYELHIVHPTFPLLIPCYLQILFVSKLNKQTKRLQFCAICTPLAGIGVSIWLIGSKLATECWWLHWYWPPAGWPLIGHLLLTSCPLEGHLAIGVLSTTPSTSWTHVAMVKLSTPSHMAMSSIPK